MGDPHSALASAHCKSVATCMKSVATANRMLPSYFPERPSADMIVTVELISAVYKSADKSEQ